MQGLNTSIYVILQNGFYSREKYGSATSTKAFVGVLEHRCNSLTVNKKHGVSRPRHLSSIAWHLAFSFTGRVPTSTPGEGQHWNVPPWRNDASKARQAVFAGASSTPSRQAENRPSTRGRVLRLTVARDTFYSTVYCNISNQF